MVFKQAIFVLLVALISCKSAPEKSKDQPLFYRPEESIVEIYKTDPIDLQLTVYPPPTGAAEMARGAVLFIHGGGWRTDGSDIPLFQDWEPLLHQYGLRAFSVEHRTTPRYNGIDPVYDVIDAVDYIQENSERFAIPKNRIVLIGFSSGGQLALLASLLDSRELHATPIRGAVSFYGPTDLIELSKSNKTEIRYYLDGYLPRYREYIHLRHLKDRSNSELPRKSTIGNSLSGSPTIQDTLNQERTLKDIERDWQSFSPVHQLHGNAPPMMLIHGNRDDMIPVANAISFKQKGNAVKSNLVRLILLPGAGHNFNQSRSQWARNAETKVFETIETWIESD